MFGFLLSAFLLSVSGFASAAVRGVEVNSVLPAPNLSPHTLLIRSYPAVENYQSDLYEVYSEPYHYDLRPVSAVALIEGENGIAGEIIFTQKHAPAGPVYIKGNITGLTPGKHGLHVHQAGDLRNGCEKLGPHFNPFLLQHGGPADHLRHVGDMGNIEAGENGVGEISYVDPLLSLTGGLRGIVGRALVVTDGVDDLGRGGTANSLSDGDSGKPIACGIIGFIN